MKNIRDLCHYVKELKHFKKLQLISLLFISLSASNNAFALKCANDANDSASLTDTISSIAVPQTAASGTVIWRSENRTMTVRCWKEGGSGSTPAEAIYAYMNPKNAAIGAGVSVGLVFNGQTMSTGVTRYLIPNAIVPSCWQSEQTCKYIYPLIFTASYYVYIAVAKPSPASGNYTGADTLSVFQLDGVGGVNATPNYNFNYMLSGLRNIRFIPCEANVSVYPNNIDFGAVVAPTASTTLGSTVKSSNFKATITKSCDSPLKLTAVYSSSAPKIDENTLDLNNGLGLKVKDLNSNNYVKFGDVNDFADMTSSMSLDVPFSGELSWVSQNSTIGEFNTSMTIDVYYN